MTNKIDIQVAAAVDDAVRALGKVDKAVESVGDTGVESGKKFSSGFATVANAAVGLALAGVGMLANEMRKAVDETSAYAKESLDLSTALGITQREAQQLIQVSDDYGVSAKQVTSALEMATKRGFAPTIESLAKLADETNAIANPTERAAKLSEVFGRGWATLDPILSKGGAAIRASAKEAENMGLILSDKTNKAAEDFRVNIDNLNDRLTGFKYTVGGEVIPVINNLLTLTEDASTESEKYDQAIAALSLRYGENSDQVNELKKRYQEQNEAVGIVTDKTELAARAQAEAAPVTAGLADEYETLADRMKAVTKIASPTELGMQALANASRVTEKSSKELSDILQKDLKGSLDGLKGAMAGVVKKEMADFYDKQSDLKDKSAELKDEIDKLTAAHGRSVTVQGKNALSAADMELATLQLAKAQGDLAKATDPLKQAELAVKIENLTEKIGGATGATTRFIDNSKKIGELTKEYDAVQAAIAANAQAHEDATKRILFSWAEQKLGIDGYTADEIAALDRLAVDWGLKSQADINAMGLVTSAVNGLATDKNIDVFKDRMNNAMMGVAGDLGNAAMHAEQLKSRIDQLKDKTITIKVNYHDAGSVPVGHTGPGGNIPGAASGADFIVPPGYPNDSYPMRVQSGERVIVQTPAQQQAQRVNQMTMNIYTQSAPNVIDEFGLMRAMLGA